MTNSEVKQIKNDLRERIKEARRESVQPAVVFSIANVMCNQLVIMKALLALLPPDEKP